MLCIFIFSVFISCETVEAQRKSSSENRIARLENEVKSLSDKLKTLEARISALEALRAFRSPEELRHAMIQSSKDAIISDFNSLASQAYQYRIRPATMGGGGGYYRGYTIPRRLASNDNAEYEAIVSSDSTVVFTGTSKHKLGTVKATLDNDGRLGSFEYTGEFP
jgi:hypothetical protein